MQYWTVFYLNVCGRPIMWLIPSQDGVGVENRAGVSQQQLDKGHGKLHNIIVEPNSPSDRPGYKV